jgi:hypothetical protein
MKLILLPCIPPQTPKTTVYVCPISHKQSFPLERELMHCQRAVTNGSNSSAKTPISQPNAKGLTTWKIRSPYPDLPRCQVALSLIARMIKNWSGRFYD